MRSLKPGRTEYSLAGYGSMIADTVRMNAYRAALAASIEPGDVVLDIGAGTGIMALLACQLGAGKVYALETSDAIAVGMALARANGYDRRIEFIQRPSFDLSLKRKADVMVSDLRGVLPLHGRHIASVADARTRLLRRGGTQIPQLDRVHGQLVTDAELHAKELRVWREGAFGLDLSAALRWAAHAWRKAELRPEAMIGQPRELFALDYRSIESGDAGGEARWRLERATTAHGLGAWFDTSLCDGVGFSNAPGQPQAIYGQAFFPFAEPLQLERGDEARVALAARLVGGDYVWSWQATVGNRTLRQSSFQATPVNPARLARRGRRKP
jgi:protein arginine N-methyltransferase 1